MHFASFLLEILMQKPSFFLTHSPAVPDCFDYRSPGLFLSVSVGLIIHSPFLEIITLSPQTSRIFMLDLAITED